MNAALKLAVVLVLFGVAAARAGDVATPWTGKSPAESRLILESAQFEGSGVVKAGVQIKLDSGWWTYWRAPGASGMPPMFDWSGSENLADDPETIWPMPLRAVAYGEKLNVYRDEVVFPIEFRAADPTKPVKLHLKITYGVCRNMCVPAWAEHELTLQPAAGEREIDETNAKLIEAYSGRGPSADPQTAGMEIREVRAAVEGDQVMLSVRVRGLGGERRTLVLVEGPGFVRVAEIEPSAVDEGGVAVLKLTIGTARKFRSLKGKRIRINVIHGERALEQVWVVGAQGSSTAGVGLTPVPRRPVDKPEPWAHALSALE